MDFSWTELQQEYYDRVSEFVTRHLSCPFAEQQDRHAFTDDQWRACGDVGLLGLSVPEAYGGMGFDALTTARMIEAFGLGCHDMGLVFSVSAHLFAVLMPLVEHGSEALKAEVLPKLVSGAWVGANAITEAESGSDVFAMHTTCREDGDHYILDGEKSYVTNGPKADVVLVYATRNKAFGYLGICAFLVDRGTPGMTMGKPFHKMGLNNSPISSVYFENCRVPASRMVGGVGQGGGVFTGSMQWERACLFGGYVGMMQRQLDRLVAYTRERRQFRKPLSGNQAVAHTLADMKLRLEAARLLLYRACWRFDQGETSLLDISMSKLAISEAVVQSSLHSIHLHGGIGYTRDLGIEQELRDAVPSTIFSGTSEIQRELIAKELGL